MEEKIEELSDRTPLQFAAQLNDLSYFDDVKNILTKEDLTATFLDNTPLIWGVCNSSISFVLKLLERSQGIECDQVNIKSQHRIYLNTPLIIAVSKGWAHKESIKSNESKDSSSLAQSDIAKALLKAGARVNEVDVHGRSALHYACLHRNYNAIESLMFANADITLKDAYGFTPIDYCCVPYLFVEKILTHATGGAKSYTFTLENENFDNNTSFYNSLCKVLERKAIQCSTKLLKELEEYNQISPQQMTKLTSDIYRYAQTLYKLSGFKIDWNDYEHILIGSIGTQSDFTKQSIISIDENTAKKIRAILNLCNALEKETIARININADKTTKISYPSSRIIELIDAQLNNIDLIVPTSISFFKNIPVESLFLDKLKNEVATQYQLPIGDPLNIRLGL